MKIQYVTALLVLCIFGTSTYGQKKFKVSAKQTTTSRDIYSLIDEKGKKIRQLDSSQYYMSLSNEAYGYFAIFHKKGNSGWTAIDANGKELFKVYNTSIGEPSPDYLIENKIRIIDKNEKIGFADYKGRIIITPQFEIATSFHNGRAIIGQTCKKIPWLEHTKESDCQHYSIECEKHGYINEKGVILKLGSYSFEQIMKEIKWKMPDEY